LVLLFLVAVIENHQTIRSLVSNTIFKFSQVCKHSLATVDGYLSFGQLKNKEVFVARRLFKPD